MTTDGQLDTTAAGCVYFQEQEVVVHYLCPGWLRVVGIQKANERRKDSNAID